jgi:hypothetical protein
MQLSTHDYARILLALFSHMTSSLPLQKLTTNNQTIYIDDSIDYSQAIFIFLLRTHSNAREILLVYTEDREVVSNKIHDIQLVERGSPPDVRASSRVLFFVLKTCSFVTL